MGDRAGEAVTATGGLRLGNGVLRCPWHKRPTLWRDFGDGRGEAYCPECDAEDAAVDVIHPTFEEDDDGY